MSAPLRILGRLAARWGRSRAARTVALLLVLLGIFALPRLVALRGVSNTSHLVFMDMFYHLTKLDVMHKRQTLGHEQLQDPYFKQNPGLLRPYENMRWPRGVYEVGRLWIGSFGPQSIWTVQLTNLPFTLLLALGVVGLGRAMGGTRLGLWAAALTLLCPALVAHSWYFSLDYPLVAMVTVGLYLLWRTRGFCSGRDSLIFAVWSSLGLTIKTTYGLYLLGPAAVALVLGLLEPGPPGRRRVVLHAALATLATLALSFMINGWDPGLLWREFVVHLVGEVEPGLSFKTLEPWTLRWAGSMVVFAVANFPWPLLILALPGLILAHTRTPLSGRWLWLGFFWGTCLVLTLMANKMERYLQPVYPLLCLLSVWWVYARVPRRWRRVALVWITTAYAAVLLVVHEHPTPWFPDRESATTERYMHELGMPGRAVLDGLRRYTYHPGCDLRPLLDQVAALGRRSSRPLAFGVQWPKDAASAPRQLTTHNLVLPLIQRLRGRFVFHHDDTNRVPLSPLLRAAPNLMVLHPPGLDLRQRHPELQELDHRDLAVWCEQDGTVRARLTLYQGGGPG